MIKSKLKFTSLGLVMLSCIACGIGGKMDDNNVLFYAKDQTMLFKGTFRLGIYNYSFSRSIYSTQMEHSSDTECLNDCIQTANVDIVSLVKGTDGKINIPLYDDSKTDKNIPLDFLTKERSWDSKKGETYKYTFLKKDAEGDFIWALAGDQCFNFYFMPGHSTGVKCFKNLTYNINIKYTFTYYSSKECRDDQKTEVNKTIDYTNAIKTCYNTSRIDDDAPIYLPSEKCKNVYRPTITITSISGTIDPTFNNADEMNNIDKYLRKPGNN